MLIKKWILESERCNREFYFKKYWVRFYTNIKLNLKTL